ncbi:MAG: Fe-S cluster assembly sulfur transfer protein SufU [Planctomycetota bacterium]|jgi:nitrogen fixation NifU-like protein
MSDLRELYQEVILDHNKTPRNFRAIEEDHAEADGHNPLCGDQVRIYVRMNGDVVDDVAFTGEGCAISKASASLMTESLKGKTLEQAKELYEEFHAMVTGDPGAHEPSERLGKLAVFMGVCEFPVRVKCATLAWHTFNAAVDKSNETVSSEAD